MIKIFFFIVLPTFLYAKSAPDLNLLKGEWHQECSELKSDTGDHPSEAPPKSQQVIYSYSNKHLIQEDRNFAEKKCKELWLTNHKELKCEEAGDLLNCKEILRKHKVKNAKWVNDKLEDSTGSSNIEEFSVLLISKLDDHQLTMKVHSKNPGDPDEVYQVKLSR